MYIHLIFFFFPLSAEAFIEVHSFSVCGGSGGGRLLSSVFSDQFAWKESVPIIADTRTSVSTQLWNLLKSELLSSNNLELFGPLRVSRVYSLPAIKRRNRFRHEGHLLSGKTRVMLVGGEQGSNEWVGQTTISTAHIPAEDHDASPANPSTWTSPSSPLNISCGVQGVHNAHRQAHNTHAHRPEKNDQRIYIW